MRSFRHTSATHVETPLTTLMLHLHLLLLLLLLHLLLHLFLLVGFLLWQDLLPNQLCLDNRHLPPWLQMWLQLLTHDDHL